MNISWWMWIVIVIGALIVLTVIYDLCQRKHTILRNYPIVGHFRYWLERFGPELRQYIVTNNNEERPFSRDQRRWVYASAKQENNYFGFGTDKDLELSPNHLVIKHAAFPISSLRPDLSSFATTNGPWSTGDGQKMAMELGAKTIDMSSVQVHPTGFIDPKHPEAKQKTLCAELLRGVGGVLLTSEGKRFANELGR